MKHPTRVHALTVLTDRVASAKVIAKELDVTPRHVSYHIKKLEEVGLVEFVGEDKDAADGRVVEHFYRATQRAWFDRETWESIPGPKSGATAAIMGLMNEDIARAIVAGTFDGDRNHISRTPVIADEEGYIELVEYLTEVLENIFRIKERIASRLTVDTKTVLTMVNLLQFDVPPHPGREAE